MLKNVIYIHIQNKAVVTYAKILYQRYHLETWDIRKSTVG